MDANDVAENLNLNDRIENRNSEDCSELTTEISISNNNVNTIGNVVRNLVGNDTESVTHPSATVGSQDAVLDSLMDSIINESAEDYLNENDTDDVVRNLVGNDSENTTPPSTVAGSQDPVLDSLMDSIINESAENSINEIETDIAVKDNSLDLVTGIDNDEFLVVHTENPLIEHDADSTKNTTESKTEKLCQLPLGRVKTIIKSDPDVTIVSAECIFLISKATEFFLQWLGKEMHSYTVQQKKKTIQLRDLNMAISEHPALEFLDGALD